MKTTGENLLNVLNSYLFDLFRIVLYQEIRDESSFYDLESDVEGNGMFLCVRAIWDGHSPAYDRDLIAFFQADIIT